LGCEEKKIFSLSLDNKSIKIGEGFQGGFDGIELQGKDFKFSYSKAGTITLSGNSIKMNLIL
jgi:hypothetical protein